MIIDNERFWEIHKKKIYQEVYGLEIATKLNKTLGLNMDAIHETAKLYGTTVSAKMLYDACDRHAKHVYTDAPITPGVDILIDTLIDSDFSLAIVSASPKSWIDIALSRLHNHYGFQHIISLQDRVDLAHKPAADGYIEAMKILGVDRKHTIIIEDSNTGVLSAKAAGAYTIGLRQNNIDGYQLIGADKYVDKIIEVVKIVKLWI